MHGGICTPKRIIFAILGQPATASKSFAVAGCAFIVSFVLLHLPLLCAMRGGKEKISKND